MRLEFSIRSLLNQLGMKHEGTIDLKESFHALYKHGHISESEFINLCRNFDKNGTGQSSVSL
ncbi:hypothetical protein NSS79_05300 [Paenibacillus sp. FSL L8-0436]|uniref:EF-hand domain-containing protein n=1 Tax=Paenibacillus borealis TaxID=160799 RepID=A0ABX3HKM9_PAEBO|nr:hypothetical protein H70357_05405 [Paenibacillus sp. FSL H7-0357]OMD50367.1 hypothetical protein BSK56_07490 [Paenibacillus borealis]